MKKSLFLMQEVVMTKKEENIGQVNKIFEGEI